MRKWIQIVLALMTIVGMLVGCAQPTPQVVTRVETVVVEKPVDKVVKETVVVEKPVEKVVKETVVVEKVVAPTQPPAAKAKYIFIFIGDGMGVAQRNAAELYLAATKNVSERPEKTRLLMNTFPYQGVNTTYDLSSVIPDSASAATAIATGYKTKSGVINMDGDGKVKYQAISELAKSKGWKVGVISSVSLDHATPAAFYAHQTSRSKMYEISMELANSGFDYFAGGQMLKPKGADGQPNALDEAKKNGYTIVTNRVDFEKLAPGSGKIIAMNANVDSSAAMPYVLDQGKDDISLAEFTRKGIQLLDNPKGFFMMVEGGKIDWACHANDAAAAIHDTIALDAAVAEAYEFYKKRPNETLIVVTGDHETGGMSIGFAGTQYSAFFEKIQHQKMSYVGFDAKLAAYKKSRTADNAKFEDLLPMIQDAFGLVVLSAADRAALEAKVKNDKDKEAQNKLAMALSDLEIKVLKEAFSETMKDAKVRAQDQHAYLLYGGYEPLSVKLTTILNQKAGIGWSSYSHTGTPVQTSAIGVGAEQFAGYYDQTDIYKKMMAVAAF